MNNRIKTLVCLIGLLPTLFACGNGEDAFTPNGPSNTNIISTKHFTLTFSDLNPEVYDLTNNIINNGVEVTVTVTAGDRLDAFVTRGTVTFRTEVGLLSEDTCTITANGSCSVKWTSSIDGADMPSDYINTITAWTYGEEGFRDMNGNNYFDDGDAFTHDTGDPFLDISHDGIYPVYDAATDPLLLPRPYTAPDSLYSGDNCQHSSLCATTTSTVIFDTNEMLMSFTPTPPTP